MPSAGVRFAGETAFLILVALGLGLAEFDPIVIGVVMFIAWVLVALLERASSKEAERLAEAGGGEPAPQPPRGMPAPAPPPPAAMDVEPEPEATVSERSARAILASVPPPLPPEPSQPKPKPEPESQRMIERAPPPPPPEPEPPPPEPEPAPEPEPEPEPVPQPKRREWNLWELQRAVRGAPDDERQEERAALLMYLREFANADGELPREFDGLVRESFGPLLDEPEPAAAP